MTQTSKTLTLGIFSIVVLALSFASWTGLVDYYVTNQTELSISVDQPVIELQAAIPLHIQTIEVADLAEHFATSTHDLSVVPTIQPRTVTALKPAAPAPVPVEEVVIEDVTPEPEVASIVERESAPIISPTASVLSDWEISRAWNLSIPTINLRTPVLVPSSKYWNGHKWDMLEEQMQVGLNHGAVAYPHSVVPGRKGSLIIAGHSSPPTESAEQSRYGHLFARLPEIELGDTMSVLNASTPVVYEVTEKFVVDPSQTSILAQQNDESILKLITCYPVGTTDKRLIVVAKKVSEQ